MHNGIQSLQALLSVVHPSSGQETQDAVWTVACARRSVIRLLILDARHNVTVLSCRTRVWWAMNLWILYRYLLEVGIVRRLIELIVLSALLPFRRKLSIIRFIFNAADFTHVFST